MFMKVGACTAVG